MGGGLARVVPHTIVRQVKSAVKRLPPVDVVPLTILCVLKMDVAHKHFLKNVAIIVASLKKCAVKTRKRAVKKKKTAVERIAVTKGRSVVDQEMSQLVTRKRTRLVVRMKV